MSINPAKFADMQTENILDNPIHGIYIPSALVVGGCCLLVYMSGEYRIFYFVVLAALFLSYRAYAAHQRSRSIRPDRWTKLELEEQTVISKNTGIYRFNLLTSFQTLDLNPGESVEVRAKIDGEEVIRRYNPVSSRLEEGHFDLIVKSYADGKISKYFAGLKQGQLVEFRGPVGKLNYSPNSSKEIGVVVGGSGITPALQLLNSVITVPEDFTKVKLIYANETENDILLKEELEEIAAQYPHFELCHIVHHPSVNWDGETGLVTKELMQKVLPPPSDENRLFICGPKAMNELVLSFAEELGWPKGSLDSSGDDQVFVF